MTMTNDNSSAIVSKVWNYAHVLKNAGFDYAGRLDAHQPNILDNFNAPENRL